MLAVNAFHSVSISFRLGFVPQPNHTSFRLHCKHTPQHRTASGNTHFHFAGFIHSVFPKLFSNAFPVVNIYSLRRVSPENQYPQFSPPPFSGCSHFRQSCFIICACGRCIHSGSIVFRELRSFLSPNPYTPLCLHLCIHLSTTRHK